MKDIKLILALAMLSTLGVFANMGTVSAAACNLGSACNSSWSNYFQFNVSNTYLKQNITNYVQVFFFNSTNFDFDTTQSKGQDLRAVTCDGSSNMSYEISHWNATQSNATVFVQMPILSSTSNNCVLFYTNMSTAQPGSTKYGTWTSDWITVHHMEDLTGADADSTMHQRNGTVSGDVIRGSGSRLSKGFNYNSGSDNGATLIADAADLDGYTNITLEAWYYPNGDPAANQYIIDKGDSAAYSLVLQTAKTPWVNVGGTAPYAITSNTTATINGWNHIAYVQNATQGTLYLNGYEVGRRTSTLTTFTGNAFDVTLGYRYDVPTIRSIKGTLDEVRISNDGKTASWIVQDYYSGINQVTKSSGSISTIVASNPCEYQGTGDYSPPCNCNISVNINVQPGFNMTINGTGIFNINAIIAGHKKLNIFGINSTAICRVNIMDGGKLSW